MQGNKIKKQQHLKDVENTSKTITRVEKKTLEDRSYQLSKEECVPSFVMMKP